MRAYLKMLPRLQAEEQLAAIDAAALAFGGYEPGEARRKMRALRSQARGEEFGRERSVKAGPAMLAAIGVRMVAPDKAENDV